MHDEQQNNGGEWTSEERDMLRDLTGSDGIYDLAREERVVGALRERGLVRPAMAGNRWSPMLRLGLAAAALFVAFWVGTEYGKRSAPIAEPGVIPADELDSSPAVEYAYATFMPGDERQIFPDYRDEPDFPDDEVILQAKSHAP